MELYHKSYRTSRPNWLPWMEPRFKRYSIFCAAGHLFSWDVLTMIHSGLRRLSHPQPVAASVGNTPINQVGAQASSDFSFMPQGDYSAKVGNASLPVKLSADHTCGSRPPI